jgi:hypothetical protein
LNILIVLRHKLLSFISVFFVISIFDLLIFGITFFRFRLGSKKRLSIFIRGLLFWLGVRFERVGVLVGLWVAWFGRACRRGAGVALLLADTASWHYAAEPVLVLL